MAPQAIATAYPTPNRRPLFDNATTESFFQRLEAEGHDLRPYQYMLRAPSIVPLHDLVKMAKQLQLDIDDLLRAGLGVCHSYLEIDRIVSRSGEGLRLGVVQHVA